MKIARVSANIGFADFYEGYFIPERPVILENVTANWPAQQKWTEEYVVNKVLRDNLDVNKLWFQTNSNYALDDVVIPEVVRGVLDERYSYTRENNTRLWINYKDHLTPFHSDTNGLYVFNVQVKGKKHWQIIDPNAPLKLYSFSQFPHISYNDHVPKAAQAFCYEFDLNEGDMLFLPPYWYHKVISVEDVNININWVGTKKIENPSRLFNREKEMMKLLLVMSHNKQLNKFIDFVVGSKEKNYLQNYAGNGGVDHLKKITKSISYPRSVWRMLKELAHLPYFIRDFKKVTKYNESPLDQIKQHKR